MRPCAHRLRAGRQDHRPGPRFALEMIQAGDVLVEYDKIIDRQLERAAITSISGFGKIYADAAKVLEI